MSDSYAEVIVHDEKNAEGLYVRIGLVAVTVLLLVFGALQQAIVLVVGLLMIPVDVYLFRRLYREYEYLVVSEELEVSVIRNRSRRKKLGAYSLAELQCMAPVQSHRLDGFRGNPRLKVKDYSSGNPEHEIYSMVFVIQGDPVEVKVEPNEAMMLEIRKKHASVIHRD